MFREAHQTEVLGNTFKAGRGGVRRLVMYVCVPLRRVCRGGTKSYHCVIILKSTHFDLAGIPPFGVIMKLLLLFKLVLCFGMFFFYVYMAC